MASQESVLHGDGLRLIAMNLGPEAASHEIAELLRRAKAGDIEAFEQIIRLHERRVFRTALRLLRRVEDAEDAAQEVYMRLHKHLRRLKQDHDIMPWLYRVTVNVCHDANRRREPAALPTDGIERSSLEPREAADGRGVEIVSMPDANADDPDANQDVVLRLASSNPNITIYWLVGQNGG